MATFLRISRLKRLAVASVICVSCLLPSVAFGNDLIRERYFSAKRIVHEYDDCGFNSLKEYHSDSDVVHLWGGGCGAHTVIGDVRISKDADEMLLLGRNEQVNRDITDLAYNIYRWKIQLSKAGYPKHIWRPYLVDFEERILSKIQDEFSSTEVPQSVSEFEPENSVIPPELMKVISSAKSFRLTAEADVPVVEWSCECGGGELPIEIAAEPKTARIFLLSKFLFDLCSLELEPSAEVNLTDCDGIIEIPVGRRISVAGIYRLAASWSTGESFGPSTVAFINSETDFEKIIVTPTGIIDARINE